MAECLELSDLLRGQRITLVADSIWRILMMDARQRNHSRRVGAIHPGETRQEHHRNDPAASGRAEYSETVFAEEDRGCHTRQHPFPRRDGKRLPAQ